MSWFEKLLPSRIRTEGGGNKRTVPEGLWSKCGACGGVLYKAELERNLDVCPKCSHHNRIGARKRLDQFLDAEPRVEIGADVAPVDPLKFRAGKKYKDLLAQDQKATGEKDALVAMMGRVKGVGLVAAAFESRFRLGSMGSWWASVSPVAPPPPSNTAYPWCALPPAAARACRRVSSL